MVSLMIAGLVINYLARNTLSVAAPTMMSQLSISTEQYSHIVVAWQMGYAFMQPVAGYIVDAIGTKMGFACFAIAWSGVCAAAALATGWQSLAFLRGMLGVTEAAGFPAGVKATTEWFPAKERSVALGWFNVGSSLGALIAPPLVVWAILTSGWQLAFVLVGAFGLVWSGLWLWIYKHPTEQRLLSEQERDYILAGQEAHLKDAPKARAQWRKVFGRRNFYAVALARFLSEPAWQTFNAWIPLYLMTERHMNIKEIALFAWLPFLAADLGCVLGGYLSPLLHKHLKVSLFTSRKLVMLSGCLCMIGPGCIGLAASPYTAILLLCIGGFAHQVLSGALYSITSDSFGKNEVATATGLGGMCGFLGAALFTAILGVLVTQVGYNPLFVALAVLDIGAAVVILALARQVAEPAAGEQPPARATAAVATGQ
ncbi:MFS transporter [Pseudomonas typographi]|uniref:MFS transporter n=1 Tax=Pseudomonas typographi TaxID=2715964 RepID=UPI001689A3CD|nr:MFS transporter [Pseudomonas typographi]MBD1588054.1 MFS transporter [Pseudomonas typographi]